MNVLLQLFSTVVCAGRQLSSNYLASSQVWLGLCRPAKRPAEFKLRHQNTTQWVRTLHNGCTDQSRHLLPDWRTRETNRGKCWNRPSSVARLLNWLTTTQDQLSVLLQSLSLPHLYYLLTPHIGAGSDLTEILTPRLIKILIKPMTAGAGQSFNINHPCHEWTLL